MKNILALVIIIFLITSCGTKKEMVADTHPQAEVAEPRPMKREEKFKKPRIDPEQLAAQLGLSEAQEKEFLAMWDKTSDDMMNAREENMGDRDAMRAKMRAVRDERQAGLKSILTDAQMIRYNEIMDENNKKMGGASMKRGG